VTRGARYRGDWRAVVQNFDRWHCDLVLHAFWDVV